MLWYRLFHGPPEHRETDFAAMSAASEVFFRHASWRMLQGVLIDLACLCDARSTGRGKQERENLTLERAFESTDFRERSALQAFAKDSLDDALRLVRGTEIQRIRHRALAHNDLAAALGVDPYPAPLIEDIRLAVLHVADFRYRIAAAVEGTPFDIQSGEGMGPPAEVTLSGRKAAEDLLKTIKNAPPQS